MPAGQRDAVPAVAGQQRDHPGDEQPGRAGGSARGEQQPGQGGQDEQVDHRVRQGGGRGEVAEPAAVHQRPADERPEGDRGTGGDDDPVQRRVRPAPVRVPGYQTDQPHAEQHLLGQVEQGDHGDEGFVGPQPGSQGPGRVGGDGQDAAERHQPPCGGRGAPVPAYPDQDGDQASELDEGEQQPSGGPVGGYGQGGADQSEQQVPRPGAGSAGWSRSVQRRRGVHGRPGSARRVGTPPIGHRGTRH